MTKKKRCPKCGSTDIFTDQAWTGMGLISSCKNCLHLADTKLFELDAEIDQLKAENERLKSALIQLGYKETLERLETKKKMEG